MNYKELESDNLDIIMNKIREEIFNESNDKKNNNYLNIDNGKIKMQCKKVDCIQNLVKLDDLINEATIGRLIGQNLPLMHKQKGLKRKLAINVAKVFLRISQLITRDIRDFNTLVIKLFKTIDTNLNALDNENREVNNKINELQVMFEEQRNENKEVNSKINELLVIFEEQKNENKEANNRINEVAKLYYSKNELLPYIDIVENISKIDIDETIRKINRLEFDCREANKNNSTLRAIQHFSNNKLNKLIRSNEYSNTENKNNQADICVSKPGGIDDLFYSEFEERFRGSREDIKDRQRIYLHILNKMDENALIIDLGCGRGEWLELMKENNYNAIGVDINEIQLFKCKEKGFQVVEKDAIEYLRELKDESVSVITGFHIVEHLTFGNLMELFEEAYRVLKPNGIVILETPNPQNLRVGASNFYIDPTHLRPIHPEALKFFAESKGYRNIEVILANSSKEYEQLVMPISQGTDQMVWKQNIDQLNNLLYNAQDYALVGYKI